MENRNRFMNLLAFKGIWYSYWKLGAIPDNHDVIVKFSYYLELKKERHNYETNIETYRWAFYDFHSVFSVSYLLILYLLSCECLKNVNKVIILSPETLVQKLSISWAGVKHY